MATLLKNNSAVGLYILEEENDQLETNNTPGEIDLENLTLGDTYIYFDTVIRFEHKVTANKEGTDFVGFWSWQSAATPGSVSASTGGARRGYILATVETTATQQANFEKFFNLNAAVGDGQKFLIRQWASETFREFPYGATNKKYAKVIMRGYDITETEDKGKDCQLLNIAFEEVSTRN